jgi:hypothetical protein
MQCEIVRVHFADRLAEAPSGERDVEVERHLRECAACRAEANQLAETWQMLGAIDCAPPDSTRLRARLQRIAGAYESEPAGAARPPLPQRLRAYFPQWQFAAAVAALLFVLGIGVGRYTWPRSPAQAPEIVGLREELRSLREMVTLSLLQQQSASERLRGITWTRQLDQPGGEIAAALLDTLMHDPNVNVRLASIDALKRFAEREAVRRGAIQALSQQTSPLVQIALIDFVVEVNGPQAADALRRVSGDPTLDEAVRARAAQGLAEIG